ncbi:MAG: phosphoribosylformylglycinamidine synthase, partial [Muribaculaceae bacterium]|nr:phosphoribosylformylglycinamidine synthase [Muribaculaceae bacterium]
MITFFKKGVDTIYAVDSDHALDAQESKKLEWLLGGQKMRETTLRGTFVGPRREMVTPWSTNAVEITQNMAMTGISRIEEFCVSPVATPAFDKMLQRLYVVLDGDLFNVTRQPDPLVYIDDMERYNQAEGLALSAEEIAYLNDLSA